VLLANVKYSCKRRKQHTMRKYPPIIFDAERMKYAHTGIYHYCLHLGNALLQQVANHNKRIGFYLPRATGKVFGQDQFYIRQHSLHKLLMPALSNHIIWHSTYQGTNYFPTLSNIRKILTVHDLNFLHEDKPAHKQKKYLGALQEKINRSDKIVVISNFVKQELQDNLQIAPGKIEVIYNGCNITEGVIPKKPALPFEGPFLFSIGTIAAKKNFHVLPAALLDNDYHLVIAGIVQDEKYMQKIIDEATKLGVKERVHLVGAVSESEKYWLIQRCEVFIFPSVADGFGLPVIEAMHFGKAVLLSTATSLPEIGGSHAFYLNSFEPEHISAMVAHSIAHATEELKTNTIEWSKQFSWEHAAKQYWDVYETLLND
jgi:glycosyltransferase involved in cell wall biosynthesis